MPAPRNETSRFVSTLRAASSLRCETSSGSESAGSSSSARPRRTAAGICSNRSATDSTPIVASICSRSWSVRERKLKRLSTQLLLVQDLLVTGDVEQRVDLARLRKPDPDQPALAVWILVHGLGRLDHLLVHLEHLAGERRDQIRDGLDGFDLAVGAVLGDRRSRVRRFEVDELAERVLGEPRDPERRLVTVHAGPVVLAVVLQLLGIALSRRHSGRPPSCRSAS